MLVVVVVGAVVVVVVAAVVVFVLFFVLHTLLVNIPTSDRYSSSIHISVYNYAPKLPDA